jgi:hypothetical protein
MAVPVKYMAISNHCKGVLARSRQAAKSRSSSVGDVIEVALAD